MLACFFHFLYSLGVMHRATRNSPSVYRKVVRVNVSSGSVNTRRSMAVDEPEVEMRKRMK